VKTVFFENKLYIWKYFVFNIRADPPRPQTVLFYGYDSATIPSKKVYGENLLNLGKFSWICAKLR